MNQNNSFVRITTLEITNDSNDNKHYYCFYACRLYDCTPTRAWSCLVIWFPGIVNVNGSCSLNEKMLKEGTQAAHPFFVAPNGS
uniref:Uncharacterized protein n=1 Tax=Syphacia muris TaxID=451379 RepID=A0A0N5AEZ5_9BILA